MILDKFENLPYYDIGSNITIAGVLLRGQGKSYIIPLPREGDFIEDEVSYIPMNFDQFKRLIRQMDLQEMEIFESGKQTKIIVRKTQRHLDQSIVWKVFARDGWRCRYCGIGDGVQMSYDHIRLWENEGPTTIENGICSCKKCNRTRGNMEYGVWLESPYYKESSKNLSADVRVKNDEVLLFIDDIPSRISTRRR